MALTPVVCYKYTERMNGESCVAISSLGLKEKLPVDNWDLVQWRIKDYLNGTESLGFVAHNYIGPGMSLFVLYSGMYLL